MQAEREIEATLEQLADYADSGATSAAASYRRPLFNAARHLTRLAHARDKLVRSGRSELASEVERELAALGKQTQQLNDLPLLGVADANQSPSNAFADLLGLDAGAESSQTEDRGIALKARPDVAAQTLPRRTAAHRRRVEARAPLPAAPACSRSGATGARRVGASSARRARAYQGEVQLILGLMIGLILLVA